MTPEDEKQFKAFEEQGESTVRLNIANKRYGETDGWKNRLAIEWIRRIDEDRQRSIDQENADLNRRITKATEDSAKSAKKSALYSKIANAISIAALVVSLAALFFAKN